MPPTFPPQTAKKDSGLQIELMMDIGAACFVITYRILPETAQFRQPITVVRREQKTKTYIGDIVPMIGNTTLSFRFDSDGEHQFQLRKWVTGTQISSLLGIDFC